MPRAQTQPIDKADAILAAALSLFVERGYHGTAVPAIAERAGVAAGTIYHHFASKEQLVNALYRVWKERMAREVHEGFPPTATPRQQFHAVWHQMAKFALAHREAFSFIEYHHHTSYLDEENRALERGLKDFAAMVIGHAQAAGVVKRLDPTLLMELMFGAFNGMMRAHYDARIALDDKQLVEAEEACWDAIAAR